MFVIKWVVLTILKVYRIIVFKLESLNNKFVEEDSEESKEDGPNHLNILEIKESEHSEESKENDDEDNEFIPQIIESLEDKLAKDLMTTYDKKRKFELKKYTKQMVLNSDFTKIDLCPSLFKAEIMRLFYFHSFLMFFKILYAKRAT